MWMQNSQLCPPVYRAPLPLSNVMMTTMQSRQTRQAQENFSSLWKLLNMALVHCDTKLLSQHLWIFLQADFFLLAGTWHLHTERLVHLYRLKILSENLVKYLVRQYSWITAVCLTKYSGCIKFLLEMLSALARRYWLVLLFSLWIGQPQNYIHSWIEQLAWVTHAVGSNSGSDLLDQTTYMHCTCKWNRGGFTTL